MVDQEPPVRQRLQMPGERLRLVRLCGRLTGNPDAAEDLAQETLIEAWRSADRLRDPAVWQPWLSGIARNVCLRWQRRTAQERTHFAPIANAGTGKDFPASADELPSPNAPEDFTAALERAELADLLEKAMGYLPAESGQMLAARYVADLPPAEIAARWGLTENAAAVRLHRGRDALRRVLTTRLRTEAAAFGLIDLGAEVWQGTRIWCPRCGAHRLEARFAMEPGAEFFRARCPGCRNLLGGDFSSRHPALDPSELLGGIKGYKPALSRVSAWWHDYARRGLAAGTAPCFGCGHRAKILLTPPGGIAPRFRDLHGIFTACPACGRSTIYTALGYGFASPAVQRFWRKHPRMRGLPVRDVVLQGRPAVSVRYESIGVTDAAQIEILFARDTLETLQVREGAP